MEEPGKSLPHLTLGRGPVETINFLVVAFSKDEVVRLSCQPGDECLEGAVAGALERDSWEGD